MSCHRKHYDENLQRQAFGGVKLANLTLVMVEGYEGKRRAALRPPAKEQQELQSPVRPATVNWELATLKHMLLLKKNRYKFRAVVMRQ